MADDGVLLAVVLAWALVSRGSKPAPQPTPPPLPPKPTPPPLPPGPTPSPGFKFKKGSRYVLTLDFENQSTNIPQATYFEDVDTMMQQMAMTPDADSPSTSDPAHVTVTAQVDRTLPIPLHLHPPGVLYVKQAVALGPPIKTGP